MTTYFCDTSTIVKYYVTEPGSQWVWQLIDLGDPVFLVEITKVSAALGSVQRIGSNTGSGSRKTVYSATNGSLFTIR